MVTFLKETVLIYLHAVNGFKYSYLTLIILFYIIHLFAHS